MSTGRGRKELLDWVISGVIVLPFLWLYAAHFLSSKGGGTGFLDYDMAYYSAIGRSIFTRGNGILYPNPYDCYGPVIYFQWFPWLLGVGTVLFHLDPGYLFAALGIIAAIVLARVTLALVRTRVPVEHSWTVVALAMWGGGLLVAGGFTRAIIHHQVVSVGAISQFDLHNGLWFLNWGRNSVYTTEAVYHILVAGLWLGVLRKQWVLAATMLALIASTHPWTGAEMIAIVVVYLGWIYLRYRLRSKPAHEALPPLWFPIAAVATGVLFGWYYGIFLPGFPSHEAIVREWTLPLVLDKKGFLLSIALVGMLALFRAIRGPRFSSQDSFLCICFGISSLLSLHDLWMQPIQPVHFDRGYPWMALFLFGIPALPFSPGKSVTTVRRWLLRLAVAVAIVLALSDNAAFLYWRTNSEFSKGNDLTLSAPERNLFSWLDSAGVRGGFLARNRILSYLSGTYTDLTPYLGHAYLTPNIYQRMDTVRKIYSGAPDIPREVRFVLRTDADDSLRLPKDNWTSVYNREGMDLFERNPFLQQ